MFDRLIEYLRNLPDEELGAVDLESMAVATALLESHPPDSSSYKQLDFVIALKKKWLESKAYILDEQNPCRMQSLLRKTLDKMVLEGIPALNRDELDILICVEKIIQHDPESTQFDRLSTLFSRNKELLVKHWEELPKSPGLNNLDKYITYVSSRDILEKPICNVRGFGQIDLDLRGHFYSHRGDLRVLDTIPDNAIVSVEHGSCLISGHVLGHVSASHSVEILKNISGTAITSENEIRANNAINRSYLVSKWGTVNLKKAEEPKLIFAGEKITIFGSTHLGIYASPQIEIGEDCVGGEFSVSKSLKAKRFSETPTRKLIIELPDKVSCDWYGGLLPRGAERTISEIHSVLKRIENIKNLVQIAFDECEHYAANGMIYLMGGDSLINQIEEVGRAHRRLSFLDRIVNGIDAISDVATNKLRVQHKNGVNLESLKQFMGGLRDIDDELKKMRLEEGLDGDLSDETSELQTVTGTLNESNAIESNVVQRLKEKKSFWSREKIQLILKVKENESTLRKLIGNVELLENSTEIGSKVAVFGKLLKRSQTSATSVTLMKRSRATFTQIIVRSIENRKNRIKAYKNILAQLADQYKDLCSDLKRDYHMPPPQEPSNDEPKSDPFVSGVFDENVILCTQKFMIPKDILVQSNSQGPSTPGVHVIKEKSEQPNTILLTNDEFRETTLAS
jgi:hypothetical protein